MMADEVVFDPRHHRWDDYWFRGELVPREEIRDPLVERLREAAAFWRTKSTAGALLDLAADRISVLDSESVRLRGEVERERAERAVRAEALASVLQESERLRGEVELLRKAVEPIAHTRAAYSRAEWKGITERAQEAMVATAPTAGREGTE
jgi:seryl-tRNA synthetase